MQILKTLIDFAIVNPSTDYLGDCLRYQFHHMTDVCFRKSQLILDDIPENKKRGRYSTTVVKGTDWWNFQIYTLRSRNMVNFNHFWWVNSENCLFQRESPYGYTEKKAERLS